MSIDAVRIGEYLGAEIGGIRLSGPQDEVTGRQLLDAWHEHIVLLFRDQDLNDDAQLAFTRIFGEPEMAPRSEVTSSLGKFEEVSPYITVVSNIKVDGVPVGTLGNAEAVWHTDSSFNERPIRANMLYCYETPASGGETAFLNMYHAYETLPDTMKARIEGKEINHCSAYTSGGHLKQGFEPVTDVTKAPGARHPIVRRHPETGRKALFLGRRPYSWIVGHGPEESDQLLDELWAHATDWSNAWEHKWRPGDLVLWDNACAMHRRAAFDDCARRMMHGSRTKGDRPYA